jgi:hypothetical protein
VYPSGCHHTLLFRRLTGFFGYPLNPLTWFQHTRSLEEGQLELRRVALCRLHQAHRTGDKLSSPRKAELDAALASYWLPLEAPQLLLLAQQAVSFGLA